MPYIRSRPADAVGPLVAGHLMPAPLLSCAAARQSGRAGADDRDLLAGPRLGRNRDDPAFIEARRSTIDAFDRL